MSLLAINFGDPAPTWGLPAGGLIDRHTLKHYLPATSLAGGNKFLFRGYAKDSYFSSNF